MIVIDSTLGGLAILMSIACLAALRQHRVWARRQQAELRSTLEGLREDSGQRISELNRAIETLDQDRQSVEAVLDGGLAISRRAQAMQLLRSGVSPETAAPSLGIAVREMRLIARVSRILTLDS